MSKKNPINGFALFFKELQRNSAEQLTTQQAVTKASPLWQKLSEDERKVYNDRAKMLKRQTKAEKLNCLGESIAARNQIDKDVKQKAQEAKDEIEKLILLADNNGKLAEQNFHLIHINYFCKVDRENKYLPAEVALLRFNLRDGVLEKNVYHSMVYPGRLPIGYAYAAQQNSEETHKIDSFYGSKNNIEEVLLKLISLLNDVNSTCLLPVFVPEEQILLFEKILTDLCLECNYNVVFKVYPLDYLLYVLKNTVHKTDKKVWPTVAASKMHFCNSPYNSVTDIGCEFHQEIDNTFHCSEAIVIRWAYLICDFCTPLLKIALIPGQHVPKQADVPITLANIDLNVNESSSSEDDYDVKPTDTSAPYDTDVSTTSYRGFDSEADDEGDDDTNPNPWKSQGRSYRLRQQTLSQHDEDASEYSCSQQDVQFSMSSQGSNPTGYAPVRRPTTLAKAMGARPAIRGRGKLHK